MNDLDPLRVRLVGQLAELGERAEMLLDRVVVDRAVAVVIGDRTFVVNLFFVQPVVVVVPRIEPERGDAERLQVRQTIDDAL